MVVDEDLVQRAREVRDGKTRSYVDAARIFAEFILKLDAEQKAVEDTDAKAL